MLTSVHHLSHPAVLLLQLSGVTELRRQLEVQMSESATANNALSVQVRGRALRAVKVHVIGSHGADSARAIWTAQMPLVASATPSGTGMCSGLPIACQYTHNLWATHCRQVTQHICGAHLFPCMLPVKWLMHVHL